MFALSEHLASIPGFSGVGIAQPIFSCVLYCRSLFVLLTFFLLVIVLYVLYLFTASDLRYTSSTIDYMTDTKG